MNNRDILDNPNIIYEKMAELSKNGEYSLVDSEPLNIYANIPGESISLQRVSLKVSLVSAHLEEIEVKTQTLFKPGKKDHASQT